MAQNYEIQWLTPDSLENLEMEDEALTTWIRDMEGIHEELTGDIEEVEEGFCTVVRESQEDGGRLVHLNLLGTFIGFEARDGRKGI